MRRAPVLLAALFALIGAVRIAATWRTMSQTVDETPNVACGMQWLDQGRYDYGPFHPPLARIALALGPYLYGARSQKLPDRWQEGNAVLNSVPRPTTALTLARAGILPFFLAAAAVVWFWTRRLYGEWGGAAAVFVFSNTPLVLGHAGLATTDMAVAAGTAAGLYGLFRWLEDPTARSSALLGLALAFAFLGKFSSVLFVGAAAAAMLALSIAGTRRLPARLRLLGITALVLFLTVWAAYRFSWGRMREPLVDDATSQGGWLARVPRPVLETISRTPLPAVEILDGLWIVHEHNLVGHAAYLLGDYRMGGWRTFFPIALAVKSPIPLLLLVLAGLALIGHFDWRKWTPAVCALVMLAACLPARLNIGLRYLLPMFPLLAIVAGGAAVRLWERRWGRPVSAALLVWLGVTAAAAHPDYLAYFNEFAAREPERVLVDSDLDWGQDVGRLCRRLKELRVPSIHLALHYSGDDSKLELPPWEGLNPYQEVKGWIAISFTRLKTYGWVVAQQQGREGNGYDWLKRYQPVERVGKSILLYYIP
jgi:hypothetical protein